MNRIRMIGRWALVAALLQAPLIPRPAWAWGADGHHVIGAIADRMLAGTAAQRQVEALLGGLSLRDAAAWADCVKGVDPSRNYAYTAAGKYPECAVFETPPGEAEMIDFVRRNDANCTRLPTEESCHRQYHYADIAIQRDAYAPAFVGARDDDIVAATTAAIRVLSGDPAPAPFSIRDRREALLLLAHDVGDLHQPLHVGAIYLAADGTRVDPDRGPYHPATSTRGGNAILTVDADTQIPCSNLHATWDALPVRLTEDHLGAARLAQARAVPRTPGDPADWPARWGGGTVLAARAAFAGLQFEARSNARLGARAGPHSDAEWTVELPERYGARMTAIKKRQLTLAGARLAQVLQAIWP